MDEDPSIRNFTLARGLVLIWRIGFCLAVLLKKLLKIKLHYIHPLPGMLYISNMHTSAVDEMRMSQDWSLDLQLFSEASEPGTPARSVCRTGSDATEEGWEVVSLLKDTNHDKMCRNISNGLSVIPLDHLR